MIKSVLGELERREGGSTIVVVGESERRERQAVTRFGVVD